MRCMVKVLLFLFLGECLRGMGTVLALGYHSAYLRGSMSGIPATSNLNFMNTYADRSQNE